MSPSAELLFQRPAQDQRRWDSGAVLRAEVHAQVPGHFISHLTETELNRARNQTTASTIARKFQPRESTTSQPARPPTRIGIGEHPGDRLHGHGSAEMAPIPRAMREALAGASSRWWSLQHASRSTGNSPAQDTSRQAIPEDPANSSRPPNPQARMRRPRSRAAL